MWYVYTQERKRKKARIADALERRRMTLIKCGAAKWLAVASDLAQMRQKYAAQQGAEVSLVIRERYASAERLVYLVRSCFWCRTGHAGIHHVVM